MAHAETFFNQALAADIAGSLLWPAAALPLPQSDAAGSAAVGAGACPAMISSTR